MKVAIVHDNLTQRGGAERVALLMIKAFPGAPIYTALYDPDSTYPDFADADIRPLTLNRVGVLRRNHRLALPLLASAYSGLKLDDDIVLCGSWGWAHGVKATGRKIVYCYSPARWLYQRERYLGSGVSLRRLAINAIKGPLEKWDVKSALSADRYLTLSTYVQERISYLYGLQAEVLCPPPGLEASGAQLPLEGLKEGFFLCVSRLLPYKNVAAVVEAFNALPQHQLVLVGNGPLEGVIRGLASTNVTITGAVGDDQLRWLYANCSALVTASFEDYGLTPLEAAAFGKPSAVLRWGGFLDTVSDGVTGIFFDQPEVPAIVEAIEKLSNASFSPDAIRQHASQFSAMRFTERLNEIAQEEFAVTEASR